MTKFRLSEMTWPEVKEALETKQRIAIVPTATYEDHGHHLPLDTDVRLTTEVCERAASRIPNEIVLVPPIAHGYTPHHMDFPGTISINAFNYINYVKDVCNSLAHSGFTKILVVNGHGSNTPLNEVATRLTVIENEGRTLCGSINYWATGPVMEAVKEFRESEISGMAHACEFETSLYLALKPELVQMDKAVNETKTRYTSKHFWSDLIGASSSRTTGLAPTPVALMEWWSSISETGTMGEARSATKEKGEKLLEACIQGLIEVVREFAERPIPQRVDHRPSKG